MSRPLSLESVSGGPLIVKDVEILLGFDGSRRALDDDGDVS